MAELFYSQVALSKELSAFEQVVYFWRLFELAVLGVGFTMWQEQQVALQSSRSNTESCRFKCSEEVDIHNRLNHRYTVTLQGITLQLNC